MISIVIAMLVASLDSTITNTTIPHIVSDLGGFSLYAWSFVSYMIASTVMTPIAGRLSDIFGRKRVFATGILVFMLGSLLCGTSQTMLQLVLYRGVQGIGAGILIPFPVIIAGDLFSVAKRAVIQAFFSGMWGLSAVLAPLLGSFFVEVASWRWIFYINIPLCILSILLLLPYREVYVPRKGPIDYGGGALFAGGVISLLLLTVVEGNYFIYALFSALFFAAFYLVERSHKSPLIPFSIFRNSRLSWMIVNSFLATAALFGSANYIPFFLQEQGYSIFVSGLALLGEAIGWLLVAVPAGRWVLRFGYRPLIIAGNSLLVLFGLLCLTLSEKSGFWDVFGIMFLEGMAFGLIVTVTTIAAQQLVDAQSKGISTSLQFFARNIGTAVGTTIMGAFLTKATVFMEGIHQLFLYGFVVSILAWGSSLLIRSSRKESIDVEG
ncbi:MFS transporter [Paenibacillus koleovorans]|uniref:MFS transporter n=1 Tax=Paenibacillus koleovorans TaxID=121608 RepID=UPI000FD9BB23|nr:MFS transporter [Paenibacillus koleovorans]